jgi:hypothetical protein
VRWSDPSNGGAQVVWLHGIGYEVLQRKITQQSRGRVVAPQVHEAPSRLVDQLDGTLVIHDDDTIRDTLDDRQPLIGDRLKLRIDAD